MSQTGNQPGLLNVEDNPPKVLFVDDETNILSSLERLFEDEEFEVLTASSGKEGLEILSSESGVELVVSDMRMPEMDGATFLTEVAEQWPKIVRILLTGYSEISSTIEAINKGRIYRYISKPWDDNDIILTLKQATETKRLDDERLRLQALTRVQNKKLKELNKTLDQKVVARTKELQQTVQFLDMAYEEVKENFHAAISVFSNLVQLRESHKKGHSKRVADLAKSFAAYLGLEDEQQQNIYYAGLLMDIGKIGLPAEIMDKPLNQLSKHEYSQYKKHPMIAQTALTALGALGDSATIIRSHCERFDGKGYPDQLSAGDICQGSVILALAKDYDCLLNVGQTRLHEKRLSLIQVKAFVKRNSGLRYEAGLASKFLAFLDFHREESIRNGEIRLTIDQLKIGMVLSRDVMNQAGIMLLASGQRLTSGYILKLREVEKELNVRMEVYIATPKSEDKQAI